MSSPTSPSAPLTFETFIPDASNEAALDAALRVSEQRAPATALLVVGDSGSGKSHLLRAVAGALVSNWPTVRLLHTTSEPLLDEVVDAARRDALDRYAARYDALDAIVLDDVDRLRDRLVVQGMLASYCARVRRNGGVTVLAGQDPVARVPVLVDGLLSAGPTTICDLPPPPPALRRAFLLRLREQLDLDLDDAEVDCLARTPVASLGVLGGIARTVDAHRSLIGMNVDEDDIASIAATYASA